MKSLIALILILSSMPAFAQAGDAIHVPAKQQELTRILSKYNRLYDSAINEMQREKIGPEFYRKFCAGIPKGHVTGWIGNVSSIHDYSVSGATDKGIRIILDVSTGNLYPGPFGVILSLGNDYSFGMDAQDMKPHQPTVFPIGSPLYKTAYNLRSGDTVIFSGNFIPMVPLSAHSGFTSSRVCDDLGAGRAVAPPLLVSSCMLRSCRARTSGENCSGLSNGFQASAYIAPSSPALPFVQVSKPASQSLIAACFSLRLPSKVDPENETVV